MTPGRKNRGRKKRQKPKCTNRKPVTITLRQPTFLLLPELFQASNERAEVPGGISFASLLLVPKENRRDEGEHGSATQARRQGKRQRPLSISIPNPRHTSTPTLCPPEGIQTQQTTPNPIFCWVNEVNCPLQARLPLAAAVSLQGGADTFKIVAPVSSPEDQEASAELGQIQERARFDADPPTRRTHKSAQEKRICYNP